MTDPAHPWWRDAVIYQVYPRSFQDSDGDGVGDLAGIASRLEYLSWLGVDALWLSPIYPSPQADSGYDISDHEAIDPVYGSLEDFDRLVAEADRHGLRVLMDLVPSHTSIEHPWFREHPDWYMWAEGKRDGRPTTGARRSAGPPGAATSAARERRLVPALLLPRAARPGLAQPRGARGDGRGDPFLAPSAGSRASASTRSSG